MDTPASNAAHDDIDTQLGEQYHLGRKDLEERFTQEINDLIHQYIEKRFRQGRRPAMRDAHAKDNGAVRATFRVDPGLDAQFQQGVFVAGHEYKAWIRF